MQRAIDLLQTFFLFEIKTEKVVPFDKITEFPDRLCFLEYEVVSKIKQIGTCTAIMQIILA